MVKDGIILLDSEVGTELGFTRDRFEGWLWKEGDYIIISFIESINQDKGNFVELLKRIQTLGYGIMVPTAFPKMERILKKRNFKPSEIEHNGERYEVWKQEPQRA